MKAKRTRETRAAYRTRTAPARKSKSRAVQRRPSRTRVVPWAERIAPTNEQLLDWNAWLNEHEAEFEKKFPGHYLAIWDKQVVAASPDGDAIYRLARRAMPAVIPLVTFVPSAEDMPMVLTPFP